MHSKHFKYASWQQCVMQQVYTKPVVSAVSYLSFLYVKRGVYNWCIQVSCLRLQFRSRRAPVPVVLCLLRTLCVNHDVTFVQGSLFFKSLRDRNFVLPAPPFLFLTFQQYQKNSIVTDTFHIENLCLNEPHATTISVDTDA